MDYALAGHALWEAAGAHVGFHRTGGLTLAFNAREAALLAERMELKRQAGAPIEMVSTNRMFGIEPNLSRKAIAASWCEADGFADSSLTGVYYRGRLAEAGVVMFEGAQVQSIGAGFTVAWQGGQVSATRLLLACGGWLKSAAAMIGVDLPVQARVNTVTATERGPHLLHGVVGHATGLLTMKQKPNGTVLIGGGWQGQGQPGEGRSTVAMDTLLPNLRLAQFAVPGLAHFRALRSWTGFEANVPDFMPLAGPAPGVPGAFILGCVRGGYTIGPYIGKLMGQSILGQQPDRPLFDPARFTAS
jgi:glycine/D-amino acid oxidase-like deaminating enzyme